MGLLDQPEWASSMLTIEQAKAAQSAQLPLTFTFKQALQWELFLNLEQHSPHRTLVISLLELHTEQASVVRPAGYNTTKTYSDESWAHANSWADPKLLFLNAIAV